MKVNVGLNVSVEVKVSKGYFKNTMEMDRVDQKIENEIKGFLISKGYKNFDVRVVEAEQVIGNSLIPTQAY